MTLDEEYFIDAIKNYDAAGVWQSVQDGTNINTPIEDHYSKHPLDYLLTECNDLFLGGPFDAAGNSNRDNVADIVGMITASRPDLTQIIGRASSKMTPIDSIVCGFSTTLLEPAHAVQDRDRLWVDMAAKCVIAAIRADLDHGRAPYSLNNDLIVQSLSIGEHQHAARSIAAVHARVGERLKDPQTANDKAVIAAADKIQFWLSPVTAAEIQGMINGVKPGTPAQRPPICPSC